MTKADLINKIASEVHACNKCPLWKGRRNAVPGEGDIDTCIMLVGEAPGYWEDVKGSPFVGSAGKILNTFMTKIGLSRDQVFITSVVKCRPPENRPPSPNEIKTCTGLYLDRQIAIIGPKIIVTLGSYSTVYTLSKTEYQTETVKGITQLRGRVYETSFLDLPVSVIPMYHPAAVLHNPKYRDVLEKDFELLKTQFAKLRLTGSP